MCTMFHNVNAKKFNQPLDSWQTSSAASMDYMFYTADARCNTTCTGEKAVCACKANKVCTGYVTAVCYAIMGAGKMGGFFECMGVKVVCFLPG